MDLPRDVEVVLREIARQLQGGAILPDKLAQLDCSFALPEHTVEIEHMPRSAKGSKPRTWPYYILTIHGPRTDGKWKFRPEYLLRLLKAVQQG